MTPPTAPPTAGPVGKIRNPWVVIGLSIITLGIYGLVYEYKTFQEMQEYSGEGIGGALGLLLGIFCSIVLVFLFPNEVGNLYQREGQEPPVSAKTGFWILLPLIGLFIWLFKTQNRLSDFWRAHGATD